MAATVVLNDAERAIAGSGLAALQSVLDETRAPRLWVVIDAELERVLGRVRAQDVKNATKLAIALGISKALPSVAPPPEPEPAPSLQAAGLPASLSDRVVRALKSVGVDTLGALEQFDNDQLLLLPDIGPSAVREIRAALEPEPESAEEAEE